MLTQPTRTRIQTVARGALIPATLLAALSLLDLATSWPLLHHGLAIEVNPMMAGLIAAVGLPGAVATKLALTALAVGATMVCSSSIPRRASIMAWAAAIAYLVAWSPGSSLL